MSSEVDHRDIDRGNLVVQILSNVSKLAGLVAAIDKRQETHEVECNARQERIDEHLDDIKGLIRAEADARIKSLAPVSSAIRAINGRAWTAISALVGFLAITCVGLAGIVITHLLK